ncbi:MAG: histidine triad nucleotide-binding protein [Thiotrichaceae bacterium]|nr:histidine triad nucleotide-binding protein [Thiotrichaceae bacterium]
MHADCIFCKIIAGTIPCDQVYSDELVIVFKDIQPRSPVHLLVVPREHIISLSELEPRHDALMAHIMRLLPTLAKQQGLEDGFRTVINTGPAGGQVVFHLHVHLMGGNIRGI